MSNYNLHFLLSILIAEMVLFALRKNVKKKHLILGLLVIPFFSYSVFYNVNLGLVQSRLVYLVAYVGSIWCSIFYTCLVSFCQYSLKFEPKKNVLKTSILLLLQAILLIILFLIPWAVDTFPLSNTDAVLFTFFAPIDGSGEFVIKTLVNRVLYESLVGVGILFATQLLVAAILCKRKIFGKCSLMFFTFLFPETKNIRLMFYQVEKMVTVFLCGCVVANLFIVTSIIHSPAFEVFFDTNQESELYKEQYKIPDDSILLNDNPKNLLVVFVESMTNSFDRFTPELNQWKNKGTNFLPGGESVAGTGWTIAGITASLCGIPLNLPLGVNEYHGHLPTYLPGASCLTDFLSAKGYSQIAIQGSNADFTQKRFFWQTHGNVEIRDELFFKKEKIVPEDYNAFWGVEDKKMLEQSRTKLDSLAKTGKPFAAYILTVDTHQPNGFIDPSCDYNEATLYQNALRCSSRIISDFLEWCSNQSWFENTVVLVAGDHVLQSLSVKAGLPLNEKMQTIAFMLNVPFKEKRINRFFSNLDYSATILESMGWNLPNHAFGLGRSLFASESTMLEKYGRDSLDALLRQRSTQYDAFMKK